MTSSESMYASITDADLNAGAAFTSAANTKWLTTDLTPPKLALRMTITVSLATSAKFGYVPTSVAPNTSASGTVQYLNGGTALTAGAAYTFTIGVRPGLKTYNFKDDTGVLVNDYSVEYAMGWI